MTGTASSLVTAFDFVWDRFTNRLVGLVDDEYLWERVDGCWTIRPDGNGSWVADAAAADGGDERFTTIAWRVAHIADSLPTFAARLFPEHRPPSRPDLPARAADVPAYVDWSYRFWRAGLVATTDEQLDAPLGPAWGPYAASTCTDIVLHVFDETVHHTAEVVLLRDLWLGGGVTHRWRRAGDR